MHNNDEPVLFDRDIELDVTAEDNELRKYTGTWYYRIIQRSLGKKESGELSVEIKEVSDELQSVLENEEDTNIIKVEYADFLFNQIE